LAFNYIVQNEDFLLLLSWMSSLALIPNVVWLRLLVSLQLRELIGKML